jgi:hypothetical protein
MQEPAKNQGAAEAQVPTNFEEFWPLYVREHLQPANRALHFIGLTLAIHFTVKAIRKRRPGLLLVAPLVGYGFSWIGHFFVEKNRPASFKNPLWSFLGDLRMYGKIWRGEMDFEIARHGSPEASDFDSKDGASEGATP